MSCKSSIPPLSTRRAWTTAAGGILFFINILALITGKRKIARTAFLGWNALLLYPTLRRNSNAFGPIITRFKTNSKEVWLTIDDGPDPVETPKVLELLKKYNFKASFFCIGSKVDSQKDLCRRIMHEGHTVENHSYNHASTTFWMLPPRSMEREITTTSQAIHSATGERPRFFRSPAGMTNPCVHPVLARNGLRLAGWSCAGFDGVSRSPRAVLKCLLPNIRPGAIILLHENLRASPASSRLHTLHLLLQHLAMRGYACVIPEEESLQDS